MPAAAATAAAGRQRGRMPPSQLRPRMLTDRTGTSGTIASAWLPVQYQGEGQAVRWHTTSHQYGGCWRSSSRVREQEGHASRAKGPSLRSLMCRSMPGRVRSRFVWELHLLLSFLPFCRALRPIPRQCLKQPLSRHHCLILIKPALLRPTRHGFVPGYSLSLTHPLSRGMSVQATTSVIPLDCA